MIRLQKEDNLFFDEWRGRRKGHVYFRHEKEVYARIKVSLLMFFMA